MNKTINTAVFFLMMYPVIAQKGIGSMVKAEKDFAAFSVANSTKEAFLQYIDSNSVMFDEGQPLPAIEFWNKREKRPGVLNWHPQWSEISASGDFGYTTGPWTFRNSPADTVVARGQYATVWKLDKNGQWKFLVDFGIDNKSQGSVEEKLIDIEKKPEYTQVMTRVAPLVMAENNFNKLLTQDKNKAYKQWLSKTSMLLRNGSLPATIPGEQKELITATPEKLTCTMNGWGISPVPDMGYTYGTALVNGKPENYFRIWRREKTGWKIAVEVFRY